MKNILILGGTGYLGSKMIPMLCDEKKYKVYCTSRDSIEKMKIQEKDDEYGPIYIKSSALHIEKLLSSMHFDIVLNMACVYDRGLLLYDSVIESNIMFPATVLNIAVKHGVEKFITIGTGLPDGFNIYSLSKKCFAEFGEFYSNKHNIDFCNLKLEMFYGYDEPENRFIPNCIKKMILNEPIQLTTGTQHRDIIYIEDVCHAILLAVKVELKGYTTIPIGTGEAPTIREILEYAHTIIGSASRLEFGSVPMRQEEPDCVADTFWLRELGFTCKYNWKEGIEKMVTFLMGGIKE